MPSEYGRTSAEEVSSAPSRAAQAVTHAATISKIIELEIIPGLQAIYPEVGSSDAAHLRRVGDDEITEFLQLLRSDDPERSRRYVEQLNQKGLSKRLLFGELFAQSARRLGEMWEADSLSFVDVTIGLSRLHSLLREHSSRQSGSMLRDKRTTKSIHLMPAPREQHIFGLLVLAEYFRSQGWHVETEISIADPDEARRCAALRQCACIGFTISNERCIEALTDSVSRLRNSPKWRSRPILVGGSAVDRGKSVIDIVGADGSASNEVEALSTADRLLTNEQSQRADLEN